VVDERDAPDAWRVTAGWWDTHGVWRDTDPATREALHRALGDPGGPPEVPNWFVTSGQSPEVWSPGTVELEDGGEVAVADRLPGDLPIGVHTLHSPGDHRTRVFVVPARSRRLARTWGWALQVHAARSGRSWGIGDLADVRDIAERSAACGGGVLACSPTGDHIPGAIQPSPYSPSSRRFRSPVYLRVDEVDGAELAAEAVAAGAAAGRDLDRTTLLDWTQSWTVKVDALGAVFDALGRPPVPELADRPLREHATFVALAEVHGGGRHRFPAEHRHPDLPGVAEFAVRHASRIAFWAWVQVQLDRQLARAGRQIALVGDLSVGVDPDGADAWRDQDLLAEGCRIGAPPDEFNQLGQDWGLPPYVPWRLRDAGYGPWIETVRSALRHCGGLRIDHVVGLTRLYCVPPGHGPDRGAYIRQYGTELLDIACLEAERVGAALIGEDLGTVEDGFRAELRARDVAGYRVAWFEDTPPEEWPGASVGMLTTHDLPTIAGVWSGSDEVDRLAAGLPPEPGSLAELRRRLERLTGADGSETSDQVAAAATGRLWRSGADLVLCTPEDALGLTHRPNLPGTTSGHPNWRQPLPSSAWADRVPPGGDPSGVRPDRG
jgi:4-alpha-glucanotransferase